MLDVDPFLTALYVIIDDFCHSRPPKRRPGPDASLSESEVITLAIFARWSRFASERDFYRYATGHLRGGIPDPARALPAQSTGALPHGAHRGDGLAPGEAVGGSGMSLRGP